MAVYGRTGTVRRGSAWFASAGGERALCRVSTKAAHSDIGGNHTRESPRPKACPGELQELEQVGGGLPNSPLGCHGQGKNPGYQFDGTISGKDRH